LPTREGNSGIFHNWSMTIVYCCMAAN
jgi:hypothetical protein